MAKVRTTLTIDEDVLKWVRIRAARTGVSDSAVIEESLSPPPRPQAQTFSTSSWAQTPPTMSEANRHLKLSCRGPTRDQALPDGHLVRAVVDVNVLISGAVPFRPRAPRPRSSVPAPATASFPNSWSPSCCSPSSAEPSSYPKLRKRIPPEKAAAFTNWVRDHETLAEDPANPLPVGSRDVGDDYLLALAISRRAYLVTGDYATLSDDLPILTPAQFATMLRESR